MVKIHSSSMLDCESSLCLVLSLPVPPNAVPFSPVGTTPIVNFLPPQSPPPVASGNFLTFYEMIE